ncbi:ECF-type sigma factor [Dehalobacter sp.]|uniref:ECF-type sigma factor n=1 Tax=Dehalobacter sp. TaxID=1962289 RepID=UPI00258BBDB6|nr:ECF-type sigma factor [Dehalobacter sp.]MDJ0304729.1 ECF-type sigma factor [Dehalobacter sp.]
MTNQANQSQTRIYKIYLPHEKQWVEVTETQYYAYYRDIWAIRKHAQKHRQCICPKSKLWICDGDCAMCEYHAAGNTVSLDAPMENADGEEFSLLDTLEDPTNSFADVLMDRLLLEQLLNELEERDPEGKRICELIMEGQSEREAAVTLNMARSTFKRHWTAIKAELARQIKE